MHNLRRDSSCREWKNTNNEAARDPLTYPMWSLRWNLPLPKAAKLMETLLSTPLFDPGCQVVRSLRWAARHGHLEVVKMLCEHPQVDPSLYDNQTIGNAAAFNHLDILEYLLLDPRVDPSCNYDFAIGMAVQNGHADIVEALLADSRVDPTEYNNYVIRRAAEKDVTPPQRPTCGPNSK
ncbi:UNVERIFIED_CONTAM: hypothetical protein HDU68_008921 [Siphonaria sp. JEL0065]|nr:hypothetical protein HDU68_008921 [Siphonaria sp. JEL0065]